MVINFVAIVCYGSLLVRWTSSGSEFLSSGTGSANNISTGWLLVDGFFTSWEPTAAHCSAESNGRCLWDEFQAQSRAYGFLPNTSPACPPSSGLSAGHDAAALTNWAPKMGQRTLPLLYIHSVVCYQPFIIQITKHQQWIHHSFTTSNHQEFRTCRLSTCQTWAVYRFQLYFCWPNSGAARQLHFSIIFRSELVSLEMF